MYDVIKDTIEKETYLKTHILANVDETPLILESIPGITLENIDANTVKIRAFWKSKERIICILSIFANGKKVRPILIIKGARESNLEKKLNNLPKVKNKQVYAVCQHNEWLDSNTFAKWLQLIWFRAYLFRKVEDSYYILIEQHLIYQMK